MKNISTMLLLAHCSSSLVAIYEQHEPLIIETKILRTVDGNARIIRMAEFISFQKKIGDILSRKMPTRRMPDCTFKLLVAHEDHMSPKERDSILHKFIHQFAQIMQHNVFDDLKLVQAEVNHIMQDWSKQRNRPHTPLLIFATKEYQQNHEEGLKLYITSLQEFETLLEDLHLFFDDVIFSLPTSYHKYLEALKEQQNI